MPPYGGYYAKLLSLLPPITHIVPLFSRYVFYNIFYIFFRNNLALIFLSDLIGADEKVIINWSTYVPNILHMALISLDSHRTIVCLEARKAIINICLLYTDSEKNLAQVASILLNNQVQNIKILN